MTRLSPAPSFYRFFSFHGFFLDYLKIFMYISDSNYRYYLAFVFVLFFLGGGNHD